MISVKLRRIGFFFLSYLPFISLALVNTPIAIAQEQELNQKTTEILEEKIPEGNNLDIPDTQNTESDLRALNQTSSILSLQGGKKVLTEAKVAIDSQDYELAIERLQQARKVFNQLSNFHLQLSQSFSGIENRISDAERRKALESGQMRDEATYQLALVHRAQNKPELSVPLLIQIIRSQNPTSELGKKSYQQLLELGFVDAPFERK